MKKTALFLCGLLSVIVAFGATSCDMLGKQPNSGSSAPDSSSSAPAENTENAVTKLEIKQAPKTEYFVGEKFTAEGGLLTVTYEDGTTKELSMTDPSVNITAPNTSRVGERNVTVKLGDKKVTYKITIQTKGFSVSFDLNYTAAPAATVQNVVQGKKADKPADPTREGHTFYNWYVDANCTLVYDFATAINSDTTIYAQWKDNSATYYDVTYDLNYYGVAQEEYPQIVKAGDTVKDLAFTPERTDYAFGGWYVDEGCTTEFVKTTAISASQKLYAKWNKTKTGVSTYVFEAENVNLFDKAGPGYSGENAGQGMIITNTKVDASGDKFVAYQCKNGNSLEFYVACDEDISDVTLLMRFAAEYASMTLNPDNYEISVNGVALDYADIVLHLPDGENQSKFQDFEMPKISLNKGQNLIQVKTKNNDALGGTLTATAPIIDCIKITTSAVVIWDGTLGLPLNK